MINCKICGNKKDNKIFTAKEMLQGTRIPHEYMECSDCACVQIVNIPTSMADYYSNSSYGSFISPRKLNFKNRIRAIRNKYAICNQGGVLGYLLNQMMPLTTDYCVIKNYAKINSKILDVGCGAGAYINDLSDIGFVNVSGIDPFLEKELVYDNGVVIRKIFLEQVTEQYDVILSHHSFEHVPQPLETLLSIKKLLRPGGVCLLTIPVAEDLYRQYRQDCYLIQAPQHFFLYSMKSMEILTRNAGLRVEKIMRDATTTSNWYKYSELWKKDVSTNEAGANLDINFAHKELAEFIQIEKNLNHQGKGDNITFVLRNDYRA
jgi:SAM-dependent methyltransferase